MYRLKFVLSALLIAPLILLTMHGAEARSGYLNTFNTLYGTAGSALDNCLTCHGESKSIRNPYGADVEAGLNSGMSAAEAIIAIEPDDSDGDGYSNIDEITALSLPGDASSTPGGPTCTDTDSDGYSVEGVACGLADCNDNDPAINPGLAEICDDAKDNDCNGAIDCLDGSCAADPVCGSTPTCTDADGDGYSVEGGDCGEIDCNDNDPSINPGACDIIGDGIDQDCSGIDRTKGKACPGNEPDPEICNNGIDDDGDGKVDERPCKK